MSEFEEKYEKMKQQRDDALVLIENLRSYCALMSRKDAFIGFRLFYRELIKVMLLKITEFQEDLIIDKMNECLGVCA